MIRNPDEQDNEAMGKGERNTLEGNSDRAEKVAVGGEGHVARGPRLRVIEAFRNRIGVVSVVSKHLGCSKSSYLQAEVLPLNTSFAAARQRCSLYGVAEALHVRVAKHTPAIGFGSK